MQLGSQTIPEPNAQVLETYVGVINLKIIGHAPGLAFGLLLSTGLSWALGRVFGCPLGSFHLLEMSTEHRLGVRL